MEPQLLNRLAQTLGQTLGPPPTLAVVLGSGLGPLAALAEGSQRATYAELGLPTPTAPGHVGEIVVGSVGRARVAFLRGRIHAYEDTRRDPAELVRAVRAVALWGAPRFVLTNAVGGLHPDVHPGDLVLVRDHINFTGVNPLRGPDLPELGPRFPDLTHAYDLEMRAQALGVAEDLGLALREGVYAAMPGPSYETPAEVRMLGLLGGTVVGMSLVHEVIALRHLDRRVAAISVVSNYGAGLGPGTLSHTEVEVEMAAAAGRVGPLLQGLAERWA